MEDSGSANPPDNGRIIRFLKRHAALMELAGLNAFRVRAFDNAARMLEELEVDIAEMSDAGTLTGIDGIGKGVAAFIAEYIDRGTAGAYEALTEEVPETLLDLLRIPGLGQKKVKALYESLGITTLGELEAACRDGRLRELPGFGERSRESTLRAIEGLDRFKGRYRYDRALGDARDLLQALQAHPRTIRASLAGSLRRRREVVKDVDIVLSTDAPAEVGTLFAGRPGVVEVIARGERKVSVRLESGLQADLRLVDDARFPSLLHHFTGSRDHNVAMRSRARAHGMHLNEYGLFHGREGDGDPVPCEEEADLFRALGLDYVPPELREGLGEVEAAAAGELPRLLTAGDVRGMLHVHTRASDGVDTLEEMVDAARLRGQEYIAICDHSKSAGHVYGMKEADVEEQHREIDALQAERPDIRILKGIESEVRKDGSLDYDDDFLEGFDLVVAAVHHTMGMEGAELTRRFVGGGGASGHLDPRPPERARTAGARRLPLRPGGGPGRRGRPRRGPGAERPSRPPRSRLALAAPGARPRRAHRRQHRRPQDRRSRPPRPRHRHRPQGLAHGRGRHQHPLCRGPAELGPAQGLRGQALRGDPPGGLRRPDRRLRRGQGDHPVGRPRPGWVRTSLGNPPGRRETGVREGNTHPGSLSRTGQPTAAVTPRPPETSPAKRAGESPPTGARPSGRGWR